MKSTMFNKTFNKTIAAIACLWLGAAGCSRPSSPPAAKPARPPRNLAAYGIFDGDPSEQQPADGVIPYTLNSPLFSDYTSKHRFVKLPPGTHATYHETDAFDFPVGTVLAKTFAMPADLRDPSSPERLIETRILLHKPDGWVGLPYVWNEKQTEATLQLAGSFVDVTWTHYDGQQRTNSHIIPNANQCKNCHEENGPMSPLGPKARHLNRDFAYSHGSENQLVHWTGAGILEGAPPADEAPRLAVWDDPTTGTLAERARAWLEVNCAHCHNPRGPARNAGIDLMASQSVPAMYGVYKSPVAAGLGSGGFQYDILPGKPDRSILAFRIGSIHPQIMMPELGKRMVHEEGVALVRQWIAEMQEPAAN